MKKLTESDSLKFKNISAEEKARRGILGRLYGPVASFANPTRNGRKYSQELWEKVFNSDLVKERFANGGIFGELCHPADREEVEMDRVAIVMPEPPVKDNKGNLIAYVDIIDTPAGKIAYQLAKYGYKFGISTRGTGDIIEGFDGDEVDPDTYQLNALDLVEIPAVESARLQFVESLNTTKKYGKTLKESLQTVIDNASDEDKKIMTEALDELGVEVNEGANGSIEDYIKLMQDSGDPEKVLRNAKGNPNAETAYKLLKDMNESDEVSSDKSDEVVDDKSEGDKEPQIIAELQEALEKVKQLEAYNLSLQEKLSVGNAKVKELRGQLDKYKKAAAKLSESSLKAKALNKTLDEKEKELADNKQIIEKLSRSELSAKMKLSESEGELDKVRAQNKKLTDNVNSLTERFNKSQDLVSRYKKSYTALRESYLKIKVNNYGLNIDDVKQKLGESYKLKDIDTVCEDLNKYKLNMNKLPFRLDEHTKVNVKKSNEYINGGYINNDDVVSDSLENLIN